MSKYNSKIVDNHIKQAQKGKERARYALYNQYSKAMFNICIRMCKSQEDAEDVLQESFVAAFRRIDSYAGNATFGAWLKRIVINHCIDHINKKTDISFSSTAPLLDVEDQQVDFTGIDLQVEQVNQAIVALPDGYRIIANLYLLEGYDHQEIANMLGISVSTSKSQLFRAKKKIRSQLTINTAMV